MKPVKSLKKLKPARPREELERPRKAHVRSVNFECQGCVKIFDFVHA